MRIAVTYDNGDIYTHYSRTPRIKIYQIFDNRITDTQLVPVHGFIRSSQTDNLLRDYNVDVLICNRIGIGARAVVMASGIRIIDNQRGNADMAVARLLGIPVAPPPPKPAHHPAAVPRRPKPVTPPSAKPAPQPKSPVSAGRGTRPSRPAAFSKDMHPRRPTVPSVRGETGRGMQPQKPTVPSGRNETGRGMQSPKPNTPSGRNEPGREKTGGSRGGGFRK